MSYCRWTSEPNSLYVYGTDGGLALGTDWGSDPQPQWICCCCPFIDKSGARDPDGPMTDFTASSRAAMLEHLKLHEMAGHISGDAVDRLKREIAEEKKL